MKTSLRSINWLFLVLFGLAVLLLALAQPASSVTSAANLLPFGLALVASRPSSQRVASWGALVLNALWALLFLGIAFAAISGHAAQPVVAAVASLVVAAPCCLNAAFFWRRLRAVTDA